MDAAVLGFVGVLVGGYFNNFFAKDYERYRNSQAVAAALAGELESHGMAIPVIKKLLKQIADAYDSQSPVPKIPEWPVPSSPIFDANTANVGLLHPDLAHGVAYTYERIRAFRLAWHLFTKHQHDMPLEWGRGIVRGCHEAIEGSETKATTLVLDLKRHASNSFWIRPQTWAGIAVGALLLASFTFALCDDAKAPSAPSIAQQPANLTK